jgi:hypothetical protein
MALHRYLTAFAMACLGCSSSGVSTTSAEQEMQGGYSWGGNYAVGMIGFTSGGVCTGTLIAPDVVLTAGHCIQDEEIAGFYLGAGAPIVAPPGETPTDIPANLTRYDVDKTALYPGFDVSNLLTHGPSAATPDLGLLHLATPVAGIPSDKIPSGPDATAATPKVGQMCWAVGYGRRDVNGTTTVKEKRAAEVIVQEVSDVTIRVKAASTPLGGVADEGDSGGPLLCAFSGMSDGWPWRIVGTVSYAADVGLGGAAAHANHQEENYVPVSEYQDWVMAGLKQFPVEDTCALDGGTIAMSCAGSTLRYCDGARWRTMTTCGAGQVCDAAAGACR